MTTRITLGPWKWVLDVDGAMWLAGENMSTVVQPFVNSDGNPDIHVEGPDARAIEAVPDLIRITRWVDSLPAGETDSDREWLSFVHQVLARIDGEPQ